MRRTAAPLHVVQIGFNRDRERRPPAELAERWASLSEIPAAVARQGLRVTVMQAAHEGATLQRGAVTLHFVPTEPFAATLLGRFGRPFARIGTLIARLRALAPDVIHVQGFVEPIAIWRVRRAVPGTPILVQDHASSAPEGARRWLWSAALRDIAAVAFTTREQCAPFEAARLLPPAVRIFEVMEGSSAFTPGWREESQASMRMFGDPCFIWAGRLDRNKDPLIALEAFERALDALPDAHFWWCHGDAPLLDAVRERIDRSPRLRSQVHLLGRRPHAEMEQRFRAADYFVQTSHREGSGYALIEAMACGVTPLVTDIPAARRIIGGCGAAVPVGDAGALARVMVAAAAGHREAQRRAAREQFERSLSFDVIGRELASAYRAIARPA
jgi:glycosyltransferase involved in cell wall biosynthesis